MLLNVKVSRSRRRAPASKSAATGGRDIQFKFAWTGEQMREGADAKAQAGITHTVKYKPDPAESNNSTTPAEPPNATNTNNSGPRKIAKTSFSGTLVGGPGLLLRVRGRLQSARSATETLGAFSEH